MVNFGTVLRECGVLSYPDFLNSFILPHEPFAEQKDMFRRYLKNTKYLDAGDPGTGKTFPAQAHGILLAAIGNKVAYVMPPKLIEQFVAEMREWFKGIDNHLHLGAIDENARKNKVVEKWEKEGWPDILFLSYDGYREWNDIAKKKKIGSNQWYNKDGTKWKEGSNLQPHTKDGREINKAGFADNNKIEVLTNRGYNAYFFDEAHYLCGTDSIISKAVQETVGDDCALYLMTGTPIPTNLLNAYGIISIINPEAYSSYASFERQHCIKREIRKVVKGRQRILRIPFKYMNHERVHENMFKYGRRLLKRDVVKLPDPIISEVPVRLQSKHLRLYKTFMKDMMAEMESTIISAENHSQMRHMALKLISCPTSFDPTISMKNSLFDSFNTVLKSIGPEDNKVVIFAYYRDAIEFLAEELKDLNPAVVYGGSKSSEITKFKEDDTCRVIILNWVSGGAGLNLQMASHVIFYECPTSPKDAKQGLARCDRVGQKETVNVYFMRVKDTLSDRNFKKLLGAEEDINKAIKDDKDLLHLQIGG